MRILKFTIIGDDLQAPGTQRLTLNTVGVEFQNENLEINTDSGKEECHVQIWRVLSRANNEDLQIRYMTGSSVVFVAINADKDPKLTKLDQLLTTVEKARLSEDEKILTYVVILARNDQNIDLTALNEKLKANHPHLSIKTYCSAIFHGDELGVIFQDAAEQAIKLGAGLQPLVNIYNYGKHNSKELESPKQSKNDEDYSDVLLPIP